jgi:peptide-methionine (R)-S-oxide reductase
VNQSDINRRAFVGALAAVVLARPVWPALEDVSIVEFTDDGRPIRTVKVPKIIKSEAQWRKQLSALAYHVTREKGTEPPFSHEYWDLRDRGLYRCICCNTALFHSNAKFYPGTGWPSFSKPISERNVVHGDPSPGDKDSEVTCRRCDAHLGDLFKDDTASTGLRYCIDSVALRFFAA